MPITNTYDLYNAATTADTTYVTQIITAIQAEIPVQMALSKNTFDYDAESIIGTLEIPQQLRIADIVCGTIRKGGIWCSVVLGFNDTTDHSTFRVTWHVREGREYMKHYC